MLLSGREEYLVWALRELKPTVPIYGIVTDIDRNFLPTAYYTLARIFSESEFETDMDMESAIRDTALEVYPSHASKGFLVRIRPL